MFNTMVHMTTGQLVLLLLVAMVVPFVLAAALQHFFGVNNAHAHINVSIGTLLVVGLAVIALVNTNVVPAFAHAFDNVHVAQMSTPTSRVHSARAPQPQHLTSGAYNWRRK